MEPANGGRACRGPAADPVDQLIGARVDRGGGNVLIPPVRQRETPAVRPAARAAPAAAAPGQSRMRRAHWQRPSGYAWTSRLHAVCRRHVAVRPKAGPGGPGRRRSNCNFTRSFVKADRHSTGQSDRIKVGVRSTGVQNPMTSSNRTRRKKKRGRHVKVRFWGVRGSVPWAIPAAIGHGCNTPCLEITDDETGETLVLDAGSGIVGLGPAITGTPRRAADPPHPLSLGPSPGSALPVSALHARLEAARFSRPSSRPGTRTGSTCCSGRRSSRCRPSTCPTARDAEMIQPG